jgi:hypothetical protein
LNFRLFFSEERKVQGGLNDLKLTSNFGVGVRLVNFGSFVFCAVAACGWQNTEVPKFAVERGGKEGLYLIETFMLARLRVSANGLRVAAVGDFGALHCQPAQKFDRSTRLQFCTSPPIEATRCYHQCFLVCRGLSVYLLLRFSLSFVMR